MNIIAHFTQYKYKAGFGRVILPQLVLLQAIIFCVLYAIWFLPNTILVRNFCLLIGSLIGVYEIFLFRRQLKGLKIIPFVLVGLLFIWITFHLLFLSNNFALQLQEYSSIWKRSFLGVIFAYGFALGIGNSSNKIRSYAWFFFYLGLLSPALIFVFKYLLTLYAQTSGIEVSAYWRLYAVGSNTPYYIAKTAYVGFCAPTFCVALGMLFRKFEQDGLLSWGGVAYLLTIPVILFVFYAENIKNGIVYSLLFLLIFILIAILKSFRSNSKKILALCTLLIFSTGFFVHKHIEENQSWKTILLDAKIASQVDHYENWKCGRDKGYPKNDLGETVSITNYDRIAWGINAIKIAIHNPMGYGLIERSFGHYGKLLWPDSCLDQSHSGWLDLMLGIGVPGVVIILLAILCTLSILLKINVSSYAGMNCWATMSMCSIFSFLMIWVTTEISQKVFFDELLFFIAFGAGISAYIEKK